MKTYSGDVRTFRIVTAVAIASLLAIQAPVALAGPDYSSFFRGTTLSGAGWSRCSAPVTWSVDVHGLAEQVAKREIKRLRHAFALWSDASGVTVHFTGRQRLRFDPTTNNLTARDGSMLPKGHVYVAFMSARQVPIMDSSTIGLGMPSVVMVPTKEIVNGMAILRRGYVVSERHIDTDRVLHLYLHELGHVFGLGHTDSTHNVMHPHMDHRVTLGVGDRVGIARYTQDCSASVTTRAVRPAMPAE